MIVIFAINIWTIFPPSEPREDKKDYLVKQMQKLE